MVIAALIAFGALLAAWLAAPTRPRVERQPVIVPARELPEAA